MLPTQQPRLVWEEGGWPGRQEPRTPPTATFPGETQPLTWRRAFVPLRLCAFLCCCHRPLLQCLGAWPFSHWAPCLGQGQHFIAREDEMCSFEMLVPTGSHTGKKEVGQKSWAALWHAGGFVQDASFSLTTRRDEWGC